METLASPPAEPGEEFRLLTAWEDAADRSRLREARILSAALHVVLVIGLAVMPAGVLQPRREPSRRHITPLVAPLTEPTQNVPNRGPLNREFNAETLIPRPRIQVPPSPPSATRPAAPRPSLALPGPPRTAPPQAIAEPPRLDARAALNNPVPGAAQVAPPPQIQTDEKPRLESPPPEGGAGRPTGRVPVPNASVSEAVRTLARGGGGGLVVGDIGEPGVGGIGPGINLPPSPGRQASNLELLSDPQGVDFRPYLMNILAAVRRNWFAVMPESARLGRQGRVGIQFAINRDGSVPKLVIVGHSGTDAFDRAAVAGISASNPFPPLPSEFRGNQVRLQFNFSYNIPRN